MLKKSIAQGKEDDKAHKAHLESPPGKPSARNPPCVHHADSTAALTRSVGWLHNPPRDPRVAQAPSFGTLRGYPVAD